MSLENDTAEIKKLVEAAPKKGLFKPATPEQLAARPDPDREWREKREKLVMAKVSKFKNARNGPPWIGYEPGVCPLCGNVDLDWGDQDNDAGFIYYEYTCGKCGSTGTEQYKTEFVDTEIGVDGVDIEEVG
jgi:hypothetical protein